METKAQLAAVKAIEQILSNFKCHSDSHLYLIEELEKSLIEHNMPKIESLVRDHGLSENLASQYRDKMLCILYDAAGRRERFEWQAAFAKRHQLK
jgi:hypothetical protein